MTPMRAARAWRRFIVCLAAFLALLLGYNVATGSVIFAAVNLVSLVILAVALTFNTATIRRIEARSKRRPDYSLIAAMEQELYGETFRHGVLPDRERHVNCAEGKCGRQVTFLSAYAA